MPDEFFSLLHDLSKIFYICLDIPCLKRMICVRDDMAGDIRFLAKLGNGISIDPWVGASCENHSIAERESECILKRSIENEVNQIGDRTHSCDNRGNYGSNAFSNKENLVVDGKINAR